MVTFTVGCSASTSARPRWRFSPDRVRGDARVQRQSRDRERERERRVPADSGSRSSRKACFCVAAVAALAAAAAPQRAPWRYRQAHRFAAEKLAVTCDVASLGPPRAQQKRGVSEPSAQHTVRRARGKRYQHEHAGSVPCDRTHQHPLDGATPDRRVRVVYTWSASLG